MVAPNVTTEEYKPRLKAILDYVQQAIDEGRAINCADEIHYAIGLSLYHISHCSLHLQRNGAMQTESRGAKRRYGIAGKWTPWSEGKGAFVPHVVVSKMKKPCLSQVAEGCKGVARNYPHQRMCEPCAEFVGRISGFDGGSSGRHVSSAGRAA